MIKEKTCLMRLKQVKLFRILVWPYKNWKVRHLYREYLKSENRRWLDQLKDSHKGERCFIIGNGPSLRTDDLEKLKNEFAFAANRIYEMFKLTDWRPNVYLAIDEDFVRTEKQRISCIPCEFRLLRYLYCRKQMNQEEIGENTLLVWIGSKCFEVEKTAPYADRSAYIPEDVALGLSEGRTVTFDAIQMALHMGFQEIYLLGVDFNYSRVIDENGKIRNVDGVTDYFNQKTYDTTLQYYVPTKHAYTVAREYCDKHNVVIRNATRGGKLEVFERVDFDELFPN